MLEEKVHLLLQGHRQLQFLLLLAKRLPESGMQLPQVSPLQKAGE